MLFKVRGGVDVAVAVVVLRVLTEKDINPGTARRARKQSNTAVE